MKLVVGGRQTGKTEDLIKKSNETRKPIILPDRLSVDYLVKRAVDMGYEDLPIPISAHDLRRNPNKRNRAMVNGVLIDRAEDVLPKLLGLDIDTMNIDPNVLDVRKSNVACKWVPYEDEDKDTYTWESECGGTYPGKGISLRKENIIYCPNCGKKVDVRGVKEVSNE